MSISEAKLTFLPFVLASSITSDLFLTSSFSQFFIHCCLCCGYLHCVRGSYSARVPRSSSAGVHKEFVHHIVDDEVDGQEQGQDDKREDGQQREESGEVVEGQNKHMRMTHDVRTTNTRVEPRMCVSISEKNATCEVCCSHSRRLQRTAVSCKRSSCNKKENLAKSRI